MVLTKKQLNFSAIDFLSVISSIAIVKLLGKVSIYFKFSNDFPSFFNVIFAFFKFILNV